MNDEDVNGLNVPRIIGVYTKDLRPLLSKWRHRNQGVPWSVLLRRGLRKELKPLAGKRLAHLVSDHAA